MDIWRSGSVEGRVIVGGKRVVSGGLMSTEGCVCGEGRFFSFYFAFLTFEDCATTVEDK
jgi:hypothetical protein